MLKFRAHWLGQETREQFVADVAACLRLTKFTKLFFIVQILNADVDGIDRLSPEHSLRIILDHYRNTGGTLDEFRALQHELILSVSPLIDTASEYDDGHSLREVIRTFNALKLPLKCEVESGAPDFLWFKFPPRSELSDEQCALFYKFHNDLIVLGHEWGREHAPNAVQIIQRKNGELFRGVLKIHGERWILKESIETRGFREEVYLSLYKTLMDRSFVRLATCARCSVFFIRIRKEIYCSEQCSKEQDNAGALARLDKQTQRQEEIKTLQIEADSKAYWEKLQLAVHRDHTGKLSEIYKIFGGGQKGRKFIETKSWNDLTQETRIKITDVSRHHPL